MISVLILSSDGYSDCWDPFFKLLNKNFPESRDYEILLSTNSKSYNHSDLPVRIINHKAGTAWSKRFKDSVRQASYDIILLLVEDDFLRSRIDSILLNDFVSLMKASEEIAHIRLLSTFDRTKMKSSIYDNLEEIQTRTKLRLTFLPGLWRKNILLKYLVEYESPFMAEKIADFKSWYYRDTFLAVSRDYVEKNGQFYDGMPSGGLFRGKWADWVVDVFEENEINIDYSIRGFATNEFRKTTRLKSRIQMLKSPITTMRSFLSLFLVIIKTKLFKKY
ncbi:hypothetical protein LCM02_01235 [Lutimonas saemankumensis]|uniref:hypothetical protein n=1 Tax=Lutimonas saemankumensis TaxID=483016 RepID=UPI001CD6AF05|nr:hypothetical protein [Lutimonas saemankumensis]MCA0931052.1 hypothetical protein [Lutimonas saemankumensis]